MIGDELMLGPQRAMLLLRPQCVEYRVRYCVCDTCELESAEQICSAAHGLRELACEFPVRYEYSHEYASGTELRSY